MTKRCTALHSAEVEHGYADFRARREATVWQRLNRILLVLLIIAIWLVIVSLFVPPYKKTDAESHGDRQPPATG